MAVDLALLCGCAFLAGFVDAVAGGGGLIQVPALLVLMPDQAVATLFGTNKCVSICGTSAAVWRYSRNMAVPWTSVLPTVLAALVAGYAGAATVSHLDPAIVRPLVLAILVVVLAYTLWRKDLGHLHAPHLSLRGQVLAGLATGGAIGFYDGLVGPGTGSFLVLAFVGVFGFSFLHASASAKIVNVITNLAALLYFVPHGHFLWKVAGPMAVCNVGGGLLGAHLALRHGTRFVRGLFLVVVTILIARFAWDVLGA
jgi:uncharacterized membrane protein YfcA